MPTLDTLADVETAQSIILYGLPKTGKSVLAATLAQQGYQLVWLDFENGLKALQTSVPAEFLNNIDYYRIPDTRKNPVAIALVKNLLQGKVTKFCPEHGKLNCIPCKNTPEGYYTLDPSTFTPKTVLVIDSLSQVSDSAYAASTQDLGELDKLEFKHYDRIGIHLSVVLSAIQQAPFHVVCISHTQEHEDFDGKGKLFPTVGTSKFQPKVCKHFDHVVYTAIVNKKFVAASSAAFNPKVPAGSRSDLAMETGNVTLGDLLKAKPISGGQSRDIESKTEADGTVTTVAKPNALSAKLAALQKK